MPCATFWLASSLDGFAAFLSTAFFEAKLLKSNEFSFYLNTDSNRPSALLWGGVDKVPNGGIWNPSLMSQIIGWSIFGSFLEHFLDHCWSIVFGKAFTDPWQIYGRSCHIMSIV